MENKVLAKVNGREVTQRDLEILRRSVDPESVQPRFDSDEGKKQLLDELINQELIYLDAKEKNLDKENEYLNEIELMKESILKQYAVNKIIKDVIVTDEEVEAHYEIHKERFLQPGMVSASHILTDSKEKANKIIEEINNGSTFAQAAQKHSTCPSKDKGGDLGYFSRGQMVPEFEDAAFSMEIGDISEPIQTKFGFHIIEVHDKKEEGVKPLKEIKEQLRKQVLNEKYQNAYMKKVKQLVDKYKVEVL